MNGKSKMKKKLVSLLMVLALLVTMVPAAAFAQGDGSAKNPVVVYRNPVEDPAGTGFSTESIDKIMEALSSFSVRSSTSDAWKSEIIEAAGNAGKNIAGANDVEYFVETASLGHTSIAGTFAAFFGWDSVKGGKANIKCRTEENVRIIKNNFFSKDPLVENLFVEIKGYVDIAYDIEGQTYADKVSLNYAINNAENDFASGDTDYAAAVAAAEAKATAMTNETNGGITYTFSGWDYTNDGNVDTDMLGKVIDVTAINGAVAAKDVEGLTLVAVFDEETTEYDVTWDPANGDDPTIDKVEYNARPEVPADPKKPATDQFTYEFMGWTSDGKTIVQDFGKVTGPVKYTALYNEIANEYTVTWKNDNGDVLETDENVLYGTTPSYDGNTPVAKNTEEGKTYTFVGWTPEVSEVKGDAEYTAVYSTATNTYTVKFDAAGGSAVADATVGHGEKITANAATTREGFRLAGWALKDTTNVLNFDEFVVVENITLVAQWIKQVTAAFDTNGGNIIDPKTVDINSEITVADPVKAGYVFDGWIAGNDNVKTIKDYELTGDTTFTAKWLKECKVTFVSDNKTVDTEVVEGDKVTEPEENPTKAGYTFVGWFEAGATEAFDFENETIENDITLYAQWEKNPAVDTAIVAEAVTVTYGAFTMDDIINAAAPKVMAGEDEVAGAAVTTADDITSNNVGTYQVKLDYAGTVNAKTVTEYNASSTTINVTIVPAKAEVIVKSNAVKYGTAVEYPIKANCKTIDVIVGMDIHDETNLVGTAQAAVPYDMMLLLALAVGNTDIDLNDMSIEDLETLLKKAEGIDDKLDLGIAKLKEYEDSIRELIDTLKAVQAELPMDTELKISVVPETLVIPENIGLYLVASILADDNYVAESADGSNANMDAGYLIIAPNGIKTDLTWNDTDDNDIITLDKKAKFDFEATAKIDESTLDGVKGYDDKGAQSHVEYLFVGVDGEGLVVDRCTDPNGAADALTVGAYAQVAYVANWDNIMYYGMPIARPVVVAPNVADVAIIDANGNENYAQAYTYGDDIGLAVTVDGKKAPVEGLTVKYIGSDTTVDGWYRDELPTDAGVYTVVATYTENDENGNLYKAGGAVGVLIINPADAEIGLEDAKYEYDGNEYFATITNDKFDYATVAIDRANNIAYVNLPEDTQAHIERLVAMLPADAEKAVNDQLAKYEGFDGDVQTSTLKKEMNDMLQAIIDADMTAAAKAEAKALMEALVEEFENNEDVKALAAKIESELKALKDKIGEEIPDDIEAEITQYIKDAVTVNEDGTVEIDTDKLEADLDKMISEMEGKLPASVVAELKEMKKEIVKAVENNIDIEAIEKEISDITTKIESLDKEDIAKIAIAAAYEAYGSLDKEQIKELAKEAIYKIEAQGYIDYAEGMLESIKNMYGGDIDTTDLEAAIKDLIDDSEAAIKAGDIDADSLKSLENHIDKILAEMQGVIDQIPDGTIVFGKNPSEVGEYDCYAINISANYKAELVDAKLVIYEKEQSEDPKDPTNPTDPTDPTTPDQPKDDEIDTGDHSNMALPLVLATAALAAIVALFATRRRHS